MESGEEGSNLITSTSVPNRYIFRQPQKDEKQDNNLSRETKIRDVNEKYSHKYFRVDKLREYKTTKVKNKNKKRKWYNCRVRNILKTEIGAKCKISMSLFYGH